MSNSSLPLTFRQEIIKPIMTAIAAGESCALVGAGSVGKSNLMRFLALPEVRQHYLEDGAEQYLFLYIDGNALLEASEWGVYELMLHRVVEAVGTQEEAEAAQLDDLYQRAVSKEGRGLILRYLDRALKILCRRLNHRLVFLFDEFDAVFQFLDRHFFAALRALRDEHKYRLVYVIATRQEFSRLCDVRDSEAFHELFSNKNTLGLGPYSEEDARHMIARLSARAGGSLSETAIEQLLDLTGRHPGLIRAGFWSLVVDPSIPPDHFSRELLGDAGVWDECRRIWDGLDQDEQAALVELCEEVWPPGSGKAVTELLRLKGLIISQGQKSMPRIFSPLFKDFVADQDTPYVEGLVVDLVSRTVRVQGYDITQSLTRLEYELLAYLYQRRCQVCTRDEIIAALYPDEHFDPDTAVSDNRVDTMVGRLREKIEPDRRRPRYLLSVRGRGYHLMAGAPDEE
jgi:DNA-binding winged helix-turn-helix (wHTH) protein